jgi:hypothetical protein
MLWCIPKKADELREAQVMVADVWELALWYLELVTLRVIDYKSVYSNRLRERWAGMSIPCLGCRLETLPWWEVGRRTTLCQRVPLVKVRP